MKIKNNPILGTLSILSVMVLGACAKSSSSPANASAPGGDNAKEIAALTSKLVGKSWCIEKLELNFPKEGEGQLIERPDANSTDTTGFLWRAADGSNLDIIDEEGVVQLPKALELLSNGNILSHVPQYEKELTPCAVNPAPPEAREEAPAEETPSDPDAEGLFGAADLTATVAPAPVPSNSLEAIITKTAWCGISPDKTKSYRMVLAANGGAKVDAVWNGSNQSAAGNWVKTSAKTFNLTLSKFGFKRTLKVDLISSKQIISTAPDGVRQSYTPCR